MKAGKEIGRKSEYTFKSIFSLLHTYHESHKSYMARIKYFETWLEILTGG